MADSPTEFSTADQKRLATARWLVELVLLRSPERHVERDFSRLNHISMLLSRYPGGSDLSNVVPVEIED